MLLNYLCEQRAGGFLFYKLSALLIHYLKNDSITWFVQEMKAARIRGRGLQHMLFLSDSLIILEMLNIFYSGMLEESMQIISIPINQWLQPISTEAHLTIMYIIRFCGVNNVMLRYSELLCFYLTISQSKARVLWCTDECDHILYGYVMYAFRRFKTSAPFIYLFPKLIRKFASRGIDPSFFQHSSSLSGPPTYRSRRPRDS